MERRTLPGRLTWQLGEVVATQAETARTKSITLALPTWMGHRAGQHVDVRLTAEDGYQAERSYSIASPPEEAPLVTLTVERIDDGEVSPYLTEERRVRHRAPDGDAAPPCRRGQHCCDSLALFVAVP